MDYIDCAGASGANYRFFNVKDSRPQSMAGGGYVYVRLDGAEPTILYASETDNLFMGAVDRWSEAVEQYGATHLYTRLNVSGQTRRNELQDILRAHRPAMNPPLPEEPVEAAEADQDDTTSDRAENRQNA